ncbi:MAG: DHHA1 domain-containing protein [Candidatus Heimdallarchaeaceae archaeon]
MNTKTLADIIERKERYKIDVLKLIERKGKKVAYHFNCPDGIVSASMMRYLFSLETLIFIPLDYALFKDKTINKQLINSEWFAIVDLEPFNKSKISYFFDHHISNIDKEIKAEHFIFDSEAPSAASLISKFFNKLVPEYLQELAMLTEITDTASYKIPPPINLKNEFSALSWDEKTWFLEDVCKTTFTVHEHKELVEILAFKGLEGLWKSNILNRVRKIRKSRKESLQILELIQVKDFVVLIDTPMHFHTAFLAGELMRRNAKGVAYLTVYPEVVKVSLRLSKKLSSKKVNRYRVDLLAKSMGGGGHKPASGAETKNLQEALERINTWAKLVKLKVSIVDLREIEKKD